MQCQIISIIVYCLVIGYVNGSSVSNKEDWDILIFTQHWPTTVCLAWKEVVPGHTCILPAIKNIWTVHGIWPTKLGTIGPGYCNSSWHFDPAELDPIVSQLELYWGNVHSGDRYSLWQHEWEKHGTCAAALPDLAGEASYFGQGLKWIAKYGMNIVLEKAGIKPDTPGHDATQLYTSVRNVLGKDPAIECLTDKHTGLVYLFEIRTCFDKNLELTDCDGIKTPVQGGNIITNCPAGKPIIYPVTVPPTKQPESDVTLLQLPLLMNLLYSIQWLQWLTL